MHDPAWRPATPADGDAVHALRRAFCAESHQQWDEATDRSVLQKLLTSPDLGRAWVLDAGEPAGYAVVGYGFSLEFRGRNAFLDELYVAPPWRGRGSGEAALRVVADACRTAGVRALHLEVDDANRAAAGLYARAGFADHGRRLMTRWIGPRSG